MEAQPEDVNCLNNFGGILVQMKDYDEALGYFDKALAVDSNHIDVLNNKAYLLWLTEDYTGAEELSRQVLKIDHQNTNRAQRTGDVPGQALQI